ncbi:MAG: hypothetical protein BWY56_02309 [Acidobacteria bacterium ADurb.Bin340]|nr:MAG: hypothetical protein BWY56_02309 [Acidobacteria bacterium ADurb.Bin340]
MRQPIGEVLPGHHRFAREGAQARGPDAAHGLREALGAAGFRILQVHQAAVEGAHAALEFGHGIDQIQAPGAVVAHHLRRDECGGDAILVAQFAAGAAADAFLGAEGVGLAQLHQAVHAHGDVLEAREGPHRGHAVHPGRFRQEVGGHHGGDHGALHALFPGQVVQCEGRHVVAAHLQPAAFPLHQHAQAVRVGIAGQDHRNSFAFRILDRHLEGCQLLRVGPGRRGEGAIGHRLGFADLQGQPGAAEELRREGDPGSVEGGVEHGGREEGLGAGQEGLTHGQEGFLQLRRDGLDAGVRIGARGHGHQGLCRHPGFDFRIPGGHHLATLIVVGLVAVVDLGVVAGRHDHGAGGLQAPHGEAEEGRGQGPVAQVDRVARFRQHPGGFPGEDIGLQARIEAHQGRPGLGRPLQGHRRQGPGGPAHVGPVHAAQPRAHHAPQPARAEGQGLAETVLHLRLGRPIAPLRRLQQPFQFRAEVRLQVGKGQVGAGGIKAHGVLSGKATQTHSGSGF